MKIGDLVKIEWTTFASKRRAQKTGFPPIDTPGLVVDKLGTVVKVIFPERPGRAVTFIEDVLEVINESR
jgi:hypothetical protein|tara:strand:- start:233 stop:439 length:207 start_codon:yes stop_codon:yes gene_type:complete